MDHTSSENLHQLLHTRLANLAKFNPTSRKFKQYFSEDMFKTRNPNGFNEVIYFLLNIVNEKKCKEKLNMPLLDRKMEQEFRKGVQEFISDINKEDTKTNIPPITASMIQSPFGDKIVKFLLQLCQYAMRIQLHSKLNVSEVLQPPLNISNPKTSKIMMKILKVKTKKGKKNILKMEEEHNLYVSEAVNKSKKLEEYVQNLNVQIKKYQAEYKTIINKSQIPTHLRMQIESGVDSAVEEWTKSVDQEINDFEANLLVLERVSRVISDFRNLLADAEEWNRSPPCLDRNCLQFNIPTNKYDTLSIPVYNANGELSLEGFFNYGKCLFEELRNEITKKCPEYESGSDSRLLLENLTEQNGKFQALQESLDNKISQIIDSIQSNQNKLYPHYEDFDESLIPKDIFNSPNVNFQENLNTSNVDFGQGDCMQLLSKIKKKNQKKRKLSLLCSIKHKICYTSAKTSTTKIPSLIKNDPGAKLVTPNADIPSSSKTKTEIEHKNVDRLLHESYVSSKQKVLAYPRSVTSCRQKGTFLKSSGILENNVEALTTPVRKRRVSTPSKLSPISDFLSDISFTGAEQEVNGSWSAQNSSLKQQSGDTNLTGIWMNCMDTPERLENTSLPAGLESDNSLDLSTSSSSSDNNDQNNVQELKEIPVESHKKEQTIRRDSLQAILNRYKEHKKKFKRL